MLKLYSVQVFFTVWIGLCWWFMYAGMTLKAVNADRELVVKMLMEPGVVVEMCL